MPLEVLGSAPGIWVPTHFFKVVLTVGGAKAQSPSTDWYIDAFVLPNQEIANDVPLTQWRVPVEFVESVSGHFFFEKAIHSQGEPKPDIPASQLLCDNGITVCDWSYLA